MHLPIAWAITLPIIIKLQINSKPISTPPTSQIDFQSQYTNLVITTQLQQRITYKKGSYYEDVSFWDIVKVYGDGGAEGGGLVSPSMPISSTISRLAANIERDVFVLYHVLDLFPHS